MDRPFVVCHMLTSLDGKIDGAFFGAPQAAPALKAYNWLRGFYGCPATLYGTTTMLGGYAAGMAPRPSGERRPPSRGGLCQPTGAGDGKFHRFGRPQRGFGL